MIRVRLIDFDHVKVNPIIIFYLNKKIYTNKERMDG